MGMLAYFVNQYTSNNTLTPESILILFIASVLALAWAIFTLFSYHRSSTNAHFISLIDAGFFGAFIAGVYYLRGIGNADCTNVTSAGDWNAHLGAITISGPNFHWNTDKPCAMLKASWVLSIINIVFFFWTALIALVHGGRLGTDDDRRYRSRSRSPSYYSRRDPPPPRRSRSGSRYDRRSSHSHRRVYV